MVRTLGFGLLVTAVVLAAPVPEMALSDYQRLLIQPAKPNLFADGSEMLPTYLNRLRKRKIDIELDQEAFRKAGVTRVGEEDESWICGASYSCLLRHLRRIAWNLHSTGVLGVVDGKITLTTHARLKARGGQVILFPTKGWGRDLRKKSEERLAQSVDLDFSDVDPKDAKLGNLLGIIAKRFKFDIDIRDEVFGLYGKSGSQTGVVIRSLSTKGSVRDFIQSSIRPLKVEGDEVIVMIGEDGAVVITTKKYKDDPLPPEPVKPAD